MRRKALPWWRLRLWVSAFAWLLFSLASRAALPIAVDGQVLPSLSPMLERVMPAVVNISTRCCPTRFFDGFSGFRSKDASVIRKAWAPV